MRKSWIRVGAFLFVVAGLAPAAQGQSSGLPEGEGRDLVEALCTGCHQTNQITRSSGYTAEGWRELTATMIDLSGGPEEQAQVIEYLASHFPPNDRRAPTLVPGEAEIALTEWMVPTLGQRSRDPVEAPDGAIWWAGQWGNLVGRIDPATGEMKEFTLPPEALPHSVTLDRDGSVWYTGNGNGTIGRLDPATGEIEVFEMPDPAARDPHTAEFDANGILWFTLQQSNMIGRLDPATGDIRLVKMKTQRARPYGIKIDAGGVPWVACNGSNCLVRVDPATMELTEIELPLPGTTVRRLDIAEDGIIWYVNRRRAGLAASIRRPAISRSGLRRAAPIPTPMRLPSSTASSGTTRRASAPMRWSASIRQARLFRAGRSLREASMPASFATCVRPRTVTSSSTRAALTASSG